MGDVGTKLRSERERLGIGIDQIEAETHIRAKFLLAIEEERFDILPGPAYVRAFVRGYAEQLGLDSQELVAELNARPGMDDDTVMIAPRQVASVPMLGRRTRTGAWAIAVVVALALLVAVILFVGYRSTSSPNRGQSPVAAGVRFVTPL
jgi:cytoskeleton protein RodZ